MDEAALKGGITGNSGIIFEDEDEDEVGIGK